MKRLVSILFCCVFILSISKMSLYAQAVQEQQAQTQPAENTKKAGEKKESSKAGKEKTTPFTIGEIVVKAKRIANIENATTTTIVTAEDIEAHADKDLSDTLKIDSRSCNLFSMGKDTHVSG